MKSDSPLIRPARPDDAPAMARVHIETWRVDYRGYAPDDYLDAMSVADEGQVYEWIIGGSQTAGFVAEVAPYGIVGLSTIGPYRDEGAVLDGPFAGELYNLYVLPDARKLGLGRDLVVAAARGLYERGIGSMMLWTFEDYPSNSFYPRLGGRIIGKRKAMIGTKQVRDLAFGWDDLGTMLS